LSHTQLLLSLPPRRSSDLYPLEASPLRDHPVSRAVFRLWQLLQSGCKLSNSCVPPRDTGTIWSTSVAFVNRPSARHIRHQGSRRSEEHTSELQSRENLVCR